MGRIGIFVLGLAGLAALLVTAPLVAARGPVGGEADLPPSFLLKDGSRVTGTFDRTELPVETAYGTLTVPVAEVKKVIFGKVSDPELAARIQGLVDTLADDEFEAREEASVELRKIGWTAEPELIAATRSEDPEVQQRASELLEDLYQADPPPEGELRIPVDDTIVTQRFTIRGKILLDGFAVKTRFGELRFGKKDIAVLHVSRPKVTVKDFTLTGESAVPGALLDTGLEVGRGFQVKIKASGSITLTNWGGRMAHPEGLEGSSMNGYRAGALMARIGEEGSLFYTEREWSGASKREGHLFLGVVVQGSGQDTGSYKVQVEIAEAE